jgi:hypothetical protein
MASVNPISAIASISGKLSRYENAYLKTNKRSGTITISHYPKKKAIISDRQRENSEVFGTRSILASQWLEQNKPTPDNPLGTEAYQKMRKAYEGQRKIGIWYAYLMKHLPHD